MRGKAAKCPGCGHRIQIPEAAPPTETLKSREPANVYEAPDVRTQTSDGQKNPNTISSGIQVLQSRAVPAVWLLRITMLVLAVQIFFNWSLFESRRRSGQLETAYTATHITWLILLCVTGIFFLRWKYQASTNLHHACERRLKYTPRGCWGYYFLPFLNFVYPMRAMHEIQTRSKADVGYMVYIWWILILLSTLIERALFLSPGGDVLSGRDWIVLIVVASQRIVAGFFLIKIIKAVTEKQHRYRLAVEDIAN